MDIISISFFFIGCFLFSYLERHFSFPHYKWFFIIPFVALVAFRSLDVPDTVFYLNYYLLEDTDFLHFVDYGYEFGFQILTKLVKSIAGENYQLYFAVITLINSILIVNAVKRIDKINQKEFRLASESDVFQSTEHRHFFSIILLTLYVAYFGLYFNSIILRVGIAFSLIVFAVSYALKIDKKPVDYIVVFLFVLLSVLFHTTAILGFIIVLIIFFSKKQSFKFYVILLFAIAVFYFLNITSRLGGVVFNVIISLNAFTLLSDKLSNYAGSQSLFAAEGISMKFVFYWFMSFVLLFNDNQSKLYYKLFNVYIIGLAVFAILRSVLLVERVTDYFLLFSFILFYLYLIRQKSIKFWIYYIMIVLLQVIFVLRIINREII